MREYMKELEGKVNLAMGYSLPTDKHGVYKVGTILVERFSTGWSVGRVESPSGRTTGLYTGNSTSVTTLLKGMEYGARMVAQQKDHAV